MGTKEEINAKTDPETEDEAVGAASACRIKSWPRSILYWIRRTTSFENGRYVVNARRFRRLIPSRTIERWKVGSYAIKRMKRQNEQRRKSTHATDAPRSALEMLIQWQYGHKNRTTAIEHDDGFGANGGWEIRLTAGPNLSYSVNEGILISNGIQDDWCGLDYLIKHAIAEIKILQQND